MKPPVFNVCPCDLFIVIAKDSLTGNCSLLNGIVESEGIKRMRGINTLSPAYCPVQIVASITFGQSRVTVNFVPLHSFGASMLRRSMIGAPSFRAKVYAGRPGEFSESRTSVG